MAVFPMIMSGGSGTRLWPLSRSQYPKQLLPLYGENSLLQETALRATGPLFQKPTIVCNEVHRFIIAEQLQAIGVQPREIILEPSARNTAAAIAIAALSLKDEDPEAQMLVMPSDHLITDPASFHEILDTLIPVAAEGRLVTFGVQPTKPHTGYGYIKQGKLLSPDGKVALVASFVEKPTEELAKDYVAGDEHLWNSGIFLFKAVTYLEELAKHAPEIYKATLEAHEKSYRDMDFTRIHKDAFEKSPDISVDYAVMERTDQAVVMPVTMSWNDVGAWGALWDVHDKTEDGNAVHGDVVVEDTKNSLIWSDHGLTTVVGLEDVIVITTDDAVLVANRSKSEDVKKIVSHLKKANRSEHLLHQTVYRPWGNYRQVDVGERYQVKRITVKPGAELSLQKHHHRAEHWVVVRGTAKVVSNDKEFLLCEDESTYLPIGTIHRLGNPGKIPLELIEVQSGTYLGEDDIVRLEDEYGRLEKADTV